MAKTMGARHKQGGRERYEKALRDLQIELVKVQKHVIRHGHKVLVIFEGRDASGKDGTIKRIVEHLSRGKPALSLLADQLTETTPPGTFSVMCCICLPHRSWFSSIEAGTIGRAWNG